MERVQLPSRGRAGNVDPWLPRSFAHGARETQFPSLQESINVANIKSQIKRIGTNKKAQDRNRAVKSEVKTAVRATREAITAGDKEKATASLALAGKKLDKAASKGVIHKNQAANRKSAIAKQVAAL
jgi:small subunit ribosomal protein S20